MNLASASIVSDLAPTGVLRASINLGNPVLAQGAPDAPSGVTVDISCELGERLGVPVTHICFDAARKSFEAVVSGHADVCFLAIDPAREAEVAFTAAYVVIEGVYVVPQDSSIATVTDVDRYGIRIGVKKGSAYDLFLTRTLEHASMVRGDDGIRVFRGMALEVAAGIRQPITRFVANNGGFRLIDERFMEIGQALGTAKSRKPETIEFLHAFIEELKSEGVIANALRASRQVDLTVAPLA